MPSPFEQFRKGELVRIACKLAMYFKIYIFISLQYFQEPKLMQGASCLGSAQAFTVLLLSKTPHYIKASAAVLPVERMKLSFLGTLGKVHTLAL